jgi:hypothetical protein
LSSTTSGWFSRRRRAVAFLSSQTQLRNRHRLKVCVARDRSQRVRRDLGLTEHRFSCLGAPDQVAATSS